MNIKVEFQTVNELPATVKVFVNTETVPTPYTAAPPHAGYAPILAHIDRGSNFHGSLCETLYACTDDDHDPRLIVLWLGDTGSQQDDDIGRLTPIAWIDMADQDEQEDEEAFSSMYHPPLLAAMLTAMLSEWLSAGWLDAEDSLEEGDVLDQATLEKCWSTAQTLAKQPKSKH